MGDEILETLDTLYRLARERGWVLQIQFLPTGNESYEWGEDATSFDEILYGEANDDAPER